MSTSAEVIADAIADAPDEPLLDVRGVTKRFGDLVVLDGVSLTVGAGEVVALVGDNGAGKSTLVKCIARAAAPDAGEVWVGGRPLGPGQDAALDAGIAVVWQDLALCDNLDAVANLFLGREGRQLVLARAAMHAEARRMLARLDIPIPDLTRPVASLSGGQRQAIAVARALDGDPRLLILDEPTASLGRAETQVVLGLIRELSRAGTSVLLVTHQLEQVFDLADRIAVLRQGRIVGEVSPLEVHPDDVVAMQLGIEVDSTASRQLRRLGSLVEQLSGVEPTASLPLVVSAMAAALGQERLCVHLVDERPRRGDRILRRSAAVGLPEPLLAVTGELPLGAGGGPVGLAARSGATVVSEDVATDPAWAAFRRAAAEAGVESSWAAPITGASGVLGTISGYGDTVGRPRADQLELIALYASHAAASIERERMYAESQRRNRVLESIRTVLEVLAGPEQVHTGIDGALTALCEVLGAEAAVIRVAIPAGPTTRAAVGGDGADGRSLLASTADAVLVSGRTAQVADSSGHVMAVPFRAPGGAAALAVAWTDAAGTEGGAEVLHDAARSLSLGLEREDLEASHREAQTLRRSQRMQRDFLSRLSHELRTPLTAIHGCVDTLRQPDVAWGQDEQRRFLDTIGAESDRMRRLVVDLLDVSAIDAGIFRIHPDWCDLGLVLEASVACVVPGGTAGAGAVELAVDPDLGPVWGDHDRLEQVFVNLLENALQHAPPGTPVRVSARCDGTGRSVEVRVSDEGEGVAADVAETLFEPHVAGPTSRGTGLGLPIARGIARAHGGSLTLEAGGPGATFLVSLPASPDGEA